VRRIVMFNLVSADGFFAGSDGNIDWFIVDSEFDRWAAESVDEFDTVLLGRTTYELFAGYWPGALTNPETSDEDLVVARALNDMTKVVFSRSLERADWHNTEVWGEIEPQEIKKLREQPGKVIVVYGSGTIVSQLTNLGLIDEYRLLVNPVILGRGKPLFEDVEKTALKLLDTRTFQSGNVLLRYQPAEVPIRG
jgi:dihydrofolate reductase